MVQILSVGDVRSVGRLSRAELGLSEHAEPAVTALQSRLVALWEEILRVERAGIDDSFFALGGDSVGAATLCATIEEESAISLPVATLLEAETPRLLSSAIERIRAGAASGVLVPVQAGDGPPVLIVHGMTGEVIRARTLARAMPGRRVYGYRALGLNDGERPLATVEAMAAGYIEALRAVEPSGPYVVAGYCGGGIVAFEMARQLTAAGEEVLGTAVIDPPYRRAFVPWLYQRRPVGRLEARFRSLRRSIKGRRGVLYDKVKGEPRRLSTYLQFERALGVFTPEPYGGDTLVIHCARRGDAFKDPANGWARFATGKLRFVCAADSHRELMGDDAIGVVAEALGAYLDEVAPMSARRAAPMVYAAE
jgi:acetoacetyl-CoA synthetase